MVAGADQQMAQAAKVADGAASAKVAAGAGQERVCSSSGGGC